MWRTVYVVAVCFIFVELFSVPSAFAQSITVDDFSGEGTNVVAPFGSAWPITLSNANQSLLNAEFNVSGVYTPYRGHDVEVPASFVPGSSATYKIVNQGGSSYLDYSSTNGGLAALSLSYGSVPGVLLPPSSFHLPVSGGDISIDLRNVNIPAGGLLRVYGEIAGQDASILYVMIGDPVDIQSSGDHLITIPLESPYPSTGIDSIRVLFSPSSGVAFQVDSVTFNPVPEPSTLALLTLGAVGLLAWRKHLR